MLISPWSVKSPLWYHHVSTHAYMFMVVPLSHLSIPVLVPYCPNYHSFMMNFGVWQRKCSSFLQEEFPFLQSYSFAIYVSNFLVILSFYKPWIWYITFFRLLFNQWSRSRGFSGILLLSLWSGECWQFDHWFICFFYFSFFSLGG